MGFVQIKLRVRGKSSSFWWCKRYSTILSDSREHSKNVFAVILGYRDTVHEFWWKLFLALSDRVWSDFLARNMSKTFSENVSVNIPVYKCPILMFAVFPRNDHVHEIECNTMQRNKKWYCKRNIFIFLYKYDQNRVFFRVVYYPFR